METSNKDKDACAKFARFITERLFQIDSEHWIPPARVSFALDRRVSNDCESYLRQLMHSYYVRTEKLNWYMTVPRMDGVACVEARATRRNWGDVGLSRKRRPDEILSYADEE